MKLPLVRLPHFVSLNHCGGKNLKGTQLVKEPRDGLYEINPVLYCVKQVSSGLKALLQTTHIVVKVEQTSRAAVCKSPRVPGPFPWSLWLVDMQEA